jgi:DNA adenine methylase
VLKNDFDALQKQIDATLHSRKTHKQARVIYENPDLFDRVKRAWALWTLANTSFGAMLEGGYGYGLKNSMEKRLANKIDNFTAMLAGRLRYTQIECCDALKIIESRDTPETFYYLDPPYPDTDQGHYNGYSTADFTALLEILTKIQGKFLLSSFRHDILTDYTIKNKWFQFEIRRCKSMSKDNGHQLQKIEVFTANYPIEKAGYGLSSLFD